jgi:hypothetical protein
MPIVTTGLKSGQSDNACELAKELIHEATLQTGLIFGQSQPSLRWSWDRHGCGPAGSARRHIRPATDGGVLELRGSAFDKSGNFYVASGFTMGGGIVKCDSARFFRGRPEAAQKGALHIRSVGGVLVASCRNVVRPNSPLDAVWRKVPDSEDMSDEETPMGAATVHQNDAKNLNFELRTR